MRKILVGAVLAMAGCIEAEATYENMQRQLAKCRMTHGPGQVSSIALAQCLNDHYAAYWQKAKDPDPDLTQLVITERMRLAELVERGSLTIFDAEAAFENVLLKVAAEEASRRKNGGERKATSYVRG